MDIQWRTRCRASSKLSFSFAAHEVHALP
jgi:hypothetical protein